MTRYWWVNHKQTVRREIEGQFIWSPVREASGARSQSYDNMRYVMPGDWIISYAGGIILHIGRATDIAVTSPRPSGGYSATGSSWSDTGWRIPVQWSPLAQSVRPKDFLDELAPLLPEKYSPLQPDTGNGNQKTYLASIDTAVFMLVLSKAGPSGAVLPTFASAGPTVDDVIGEVEDLQEAEIRADVALADTQRTQLVASRKGQGKFREAVFQREQACRLTGVTHPELLIASHIKPWRVCTSGEERLDGRNGLLLSPDVDRLFDRGYLSFRDDGRVLLSSRIARQEVDRLGLADILDRAMPAFHDAQLGYLHHHREFEFKPALPGT